MCGRTVAGYVIGISNHGKRASSRVPHRSGHALRMKVAVSLMALIRRYRLRVLVCGALLVCACSDSKQASAGPKPHLADSRSAPASRPFAARSIWNAALRADAPLDRASRALVADLRRQVASAPPWINTTAFSTPVYRVPRDQPRVQVKLDTSFEPLQRAWDRVPIPANARPADGSDKHLVVWQPSTDTMWEFWLLRRTDGRWHARWGGRMTQVSQSAGYYANAERDWGATATSLPLLGGLITLDDLRRGRIDHALALAVPQARRASWTWPAQRTDGWGTRPNAVPEGTRFRLDAKLDVDAMNLPPLVRMIAKAAQRYGMVVRDQSGVVVLYGEDPTPTHSDLWTKWFGGQYPSALMQKFPWERLQALRTKPECCWHR
jgi:hypothetical protein